MKGYAYITEYGHDWPNRFVQIIEHLKTFLLESCIFHHVGSTSVPGMPAKDIIDLDIEYVLMLHLLINYSHKTISMTNTYLKGHECPVEMGASSNF